MPSSAVGMSWNSLEEFISFFIASQECAPLPVVTLHEDSGGDRLTNGFDLLFEMVKQSIYSSAAFSDEEREVMKRKKLDLLQRLRTSMKDIDTGCPVELPPWEWTDASKERVYQEMCRYLRDLAKVYAMKEEIDLRFAPMADIHPSHPVNTSCADHFLALCRLTKMDSPDWASKAPEYFKGLLEARLEDLARRPYWLNVCFHAYKIRLEEAGLA